MLTITTMLVYGCCGRVPPLGQQVDPEGVPGPGRWGSYYDRGEERLRAGRGALAERDFRASLALRSGHQDAHLARRSGMYFTECYIYRELGAALMLQGRYGEAVEVLQLSAESDPSPRAQALLDEAQAHISPKAAP